MTGRMSAYTAPTARNSSQTTMIDWSWSPRAMRPTRQRADATPVRTPSSLPGPGAAGPGVGVGLDEGVGEDAGVDVGRGLTDGGGVAYGSVMVSTIRRPRPVDVVGTRIRPHHAPCHPLTSSSPWRRIT